MGDKSKEKLVWHPFIGALLAAALLMSPSCSRTMLAPPPDLPIRYYNCLESTPQGLLAAYTVHYYDTSAARVLYTDQVFVFKNIEVTQSMKRHLDEGYAWVEQVKCYLLDGSLARFKPGDKVDMVGFNRGIRTDQEVPLCLLFDGCVFVPAGSLQLPAEGGGTIIGAGY